MTLHHAPTGREPRHIEPHDVVRALEERRDPSDKRALGNPVVTGTDGEHVGIARYRITFALLVISDPVEIVCLESMLRRESTRQRRLAASRWANDMNTHDNESPSLHERS